MRHANLDILLNKHIVLTEAKKAQLISELSLDEKRYLGNYMLDNEWQLETEKNPIEVQPDLRELSGNLTFSGPTTYEDGLEVFVTNKD